VLTFPLAFAAQDLEEVLTAARWSERAAARLTRRHARLGRALAAALPLSTKEIAIAVGVVAAGVGAVTAASLRNLDGDLRRALRRYRPSSSRTRSGLGGACAVPAPSRREPNGSAPRERAPPWPWQLHFSATLSRGRRPRPRVA